MATFIGSLPDKNYFRKIPGTESHPYQWEAIGSKYLKIRAKVSNPWQTLQVISIQEQKNKNKDRTISIRFQCHEEPLTEADYKKFPFCEIVWDEVFGIPHSVEQTFRFYPLQITREGTHYKHIALSIVERKS